MGILVADDLDTMMLVFHFYTSIAAVVYRFGNDCGFFIARFDSDTCKTIRPFTSERSPMLCNLNPKHFQDGYRVRSS